VARAGCVAGAWRLGAERVASEGKGSVRQRRRVIQRLGGVVEDVHAARGPHQARAARRRRRRSEARAAAASSKRWRRRCEVLRSAAAGRGAQPVAVAECRGAASGGHSGASVRCAFVTAAAAVMPVRALCALVLARRGATTEAAAASGTHGRCEAHAGRRAGQCQSCPASGGTPATSPRIAHGCARTWVFLADGCTLMRQGRRGERMWPGRRSTASLELMMRREARQLALCGPK